MANVITDEKKIDEVLNRGTIVEILPSKDDFKKKLLSGDKLRFFIGFDATAPTLHLSHAKNIMLLEKFRKLGHEVIFLFGDFTARIGDPTGEKSARKQLTSEDVSNNIRTWKKLIEPLMDFEDEDNPPLIRYNSDWLSKMSFEDVIGLASNFTVQQMLERDMFEKRLEAGKPIYLHEFFYPLMQGYDSVAMDVDVELCGTDQTFNALAGRTLMKKLKNKEKFVVAVTLMENPKTGELMSKSKGTGVFLDVSADDMYGQIMAQPDEMIEILFVNCTNLPLENIQDIVKTKSPRDAKMKLAFEITKIFHGEEQAKKSQDNFINTVQKKIIPENIPVFEFDEESINIVDLLVKANLVKSKSEARRLISQNAIKIDGVIVNEDKCLTLEKFDEFVLQRGKRNFVKIKHKV